MNSQNMYFLKIFIFLYMLFFFIAKTPHIVQAESIRDALARIKSGPHNIMPYPQRFTGFGEGKGVTLENDTPYDMIVYFYGPVSTKVKIPSKSSIDISLVVGKYEVAAEVPHSNIVPFYGNQSYDPGYHYLFKFFLMENK